MNKETSTASPLTLPWHALSDAEVVAAVGADPVHGHSSAAAAAHLTRYGSNDLTQRKEEPWWEEALESLTEPLQLLLIAVAAMYFWLGETEDAITILAVILTVAGIEVFSELRAKRAVASLASLASPHAVVLRNGQPSEIAARELVIGDVVLLSPGVRVPADVRLLDSVALRVDESSLTGESAPVAKDAGAQVAAAAELADRLTMAYAGTLITAGKGRAVVTATAMQTELGRIAGMVRQAKEPKTPLQLALGQLSRWLLWAAIGFSVLVPLLGVFVAGRPVREMVLVGLTLAFATIPEELPILITMVLGLGAYRLAKRRAIVRGLKAAETLGSVSVIATDKTGTLTLNRMRLATVVLGKQSLAPAEAAANNGGRELLTAAVLANDAQVTEADGGRQYVGDPTETAILEGADLAGVDVTDVRHAFRAAEEFPFSDERKRMSIVGWQDGQRLVAAKGSPESILGVCSAWRCDGEERALHEAQRAELQVLAEALAAQGQRVLAVAVRALGGQPAGGLDVDAIESDMTFMGLLALEDPPREEAAEAVRELRAAGVRILMVTGDHPATAQAIARKVGIEGAESPLRGSQVDQLQGDAWQQAVRTTGVFARSTPQHKLRIVQTLQQQGEVVAVTGDGVNDAPALKQAAIGVAMGKSGTDVARESADLILADDNFATVTEAVRTGRVLYANLRKAVRYYLAAKVALVFASLTAVLLKLPVPFEPVQIIIMELFMDLGASVTFVSERAERDVMAHPPRDARQPFMDRSMQAGIFAGGLMLGVAVLIGYVGAMQLQADVQQAQTAAFLAWMVGHVVLAANMRTERQPLLQGQLLANRPFLIWAAAAVSVAFLGLAWPLVQRQFHLSAPPDQAVWLAVAAAVVLPFLWEPWKWLQAHRSRVGAASC